MRDETQLSATHAWQEAPELVAYHDEPKQLPSGAHGKNGYLRLGFERRGEKTALIEVAQRTPLLVQRALYYDEEMPELPCVAMISTAGGVLQGDRYAIDVDLAAACDAHLTTQSATKIQQMDANFAAQTQNIVLGEDAYLEYLPGPTIPYGDARFISRTRIALPASATVLYAEILLPGRTHHKDGERFMYDVFSSTVAVERRDGRALCSEKFVIAPHRDHVRAVGVMGEFDVYANVLLLTPPQHAHAVFERTPAQINAHEGWAAGASRLPGDAGIVYKIVARERETVQAKLRTFWSDVRVQVKGKRVPHEFLWR